ncbi:AbrB/MazE/SpoVT family DNA-binding domain-containing protein [Candidatus Bathyarchaeota archaeon]|nr:MAG: AbrB/MazE/SpoVT family DNA-binding domain-containing protein [Candidatus Bathyarchaeota archaeon]
MIRTKVTEKYQTTIPKRIRDVLKVKAGENVEWYIIQGMVVLRKPVKLEKPVEFLTSQTMLSVDAVKLVRKTREEFG